MSEALDQAAQPAEPRRRTRRWMVVLALLAAVALAGWGIASYFADRDEGRAESWEDCAERVVPSEDRAARVSELLEEDDVTEEALERLGREDRRAHRRIEAECGERP